MITIFINDKEQLELQNTGFSEYHQIIRMYLFVMFQQIKTYEKRYF